MEVQYISSYQRLGGLLAVILIATYTILRSSGSQNSSHFAIGLQNEKKALPHARIHRQDFCEDGEVVVIGFTVHSCNWIIRRDPAWEKHPLSLTRTIDCDMNGRYIQATVGENKPYYTTLKSNNEFVRYIFWDPEGPYWAIGYFYTPPEHCDQENTTCNSNVKVFAHSEQYAETPEQAQDWVVSNGSEWVADHDMGVFRCVDRCRHIQVHNSVNNFLNGEYNYESDIDGKESYRLTSNATEGEDAYLYYEKNGTWNFGNENGDTSPWAYVESTAEYPNEISEEWHIWGDDAVKKENIKISCVQRRPGVDYLTCVPNCEFSVGQTVISRHDIEFKGRTVPSGDVGEVVCGKANKGVFVNWNSLQNGNGFIGRTPCEEGCGLPGLSEPTGAWAKCNQLRTEEVLYLLPELIFGMNNQRMMFVSAARLAMQIDRKLVLPHFSNIHNNIWSGTSPFHEFFDEDEISSVLNVASFEHFSKDCRNIASISLAVPANRHRRTFYEDQDITVLRYESVYWKPNRIKKALKGESCAILKYEGFGNHLRNVFDPEYSYIWANFIPSRKLRDICTELLQPHVDQYGRDYLAMHFRWGDRLDKQIGMCEQRIRSGNYPGWVYEKPVQSNMFGEWMRPVTYKNCMMNVDDVVDQVRALVKKHQPSFVFLATDAHEGTVEVMKQLLMLDIPVFTLDDLVADLNECVVDDDAEEGLKELRQNNCIWEAEIGLVDQWMLVQAEHFIGSFLSTLSGVAAIQRTVMFNPLIPGRPQWVTRAFCSEQCFV